VPVNPAKALKKPVLISYLVLLSAIVLVACLHLGTPFVAVMFAYFLLTKLSFFRKKWIAIICFMVLMAFIFYGFVFFLRSAWVALPEIINTAIPRIVEYADKHDIDLPFTDVDSLKDLALQSVRETLGYLGNFAKIATKEFALLIMAVVIGIAMFINPKLDQEADQPPSKTNLYSFYCALISERFAGFYRSFERVMGAQLIISLINTCLTAMFVYSTSLYYKTLMPHAHLMRNAHLVVILTFMCGFLPIVGNLISNAVIVGIAFTISPGFAMAAFIFLVVIHKLEYFLNSKIIGSRIRHPMWLLLLGLILGEQLMGIPGMILAPVILNFIKTEAIQIPVLGK